jgi:hypothetical protein
MPIETSDRILRLNTVLDRTGLTRRRCIVKFRQGHFQSRFASLRVALAGASPPFAIG